MPDMERFVDQLRVDLAQTPECRAWAEGFRAGKTRARVEIAILIAILILLAGGLFATL